MTRLTSDMNSRLLHRLGLILAMMVGFSCSFPLGTRLAPGLTPGTAPAAGPPVQESAGPPASAPPEHRIGVRTNNGEAEFFDRETGEKFVPRGANLWRWVHWQRGQEEILIDTMFNTQIGQLDSALAELPRMHSEGFNVVRVWENACWGGAPGCMDRAAGGLDPAYLKNLARFLQVAKENSIYVMLTVDELPDHGGYRSSLSSNGGQFEGSFNQLFMTAGGIQAQSRYYTDLIQGLCEVGAPTDAIFAYELHNEAFFESQLPPLSNSLGQVAAANGETYDLADPAQRRALMEDSWVHYIDQVSRVIKALDPTALVTMGFFVQHEPNPVLVGDPRLVYLHKVLYESTLDFVDLHAYPGYDLNMRQHAENFDIIGYNKKPVVMGEFGADRNVFRDVQSAATRLQTWQAESCEFGFDGWLLWTWGGAQMPDSYWEAVEGDEVIAHALSPNLKPDPCANANLALSKATQASATTSDTNSGMAVDGDPETIWNSGADAPQWIQIDLGQASTIGKIRMVVSQYPEGQTSHQIWVGGDLNALTMVNQLDGYTKEPAVLEFTPPVPLEGIRFIRIVTAASPSWASWREIEVLAP
jgi:hypothetical protein